MAYSLGVDLGTTTSAAALRRGGSLEVCTLGDLAATMPSVAVARADGSVLVGEAAADVIPYDTTLVARHVTAHLADSRPIVLDGRPHDPALLTRALLETVIDRVRRLHGGRPHQVVLTYPLEPANGSAALLQRVGEAAVGNALLIPHPVAAVAKLVHDFDVAVGTTVAVLDFGGGTFEATVVRRSGDGFDVLGAPAGLSDLGGVEIDEAVIARVDAHLGHGLHKVAPDDLEAMAALRHLRAACRAAKEQLSYSPEATVEVALPHLSTSVSISRAELDDAIRASLMAAVDATAETIASADMSPADIHVALLVGGSSRIPLFGDLVAGRLGLPIVSDPFPELTVALGAALFGDDSPVPGPRTTPAAANDGGDGSGGKGSGGEEVGALAAWFADPASVPGDDWPDDEAADDTANGWDRWDDAEDSWDRWDDTEDGPDEWGGRDEWGGPDDTEDGRDEWGGWDEPPGPETAVPSPSARRVTGPTTGETDLWGGGPGRPRRRRARDDAGDGGGAGPDGAGGAPRSDGVNPRLVAALICGAVAIVGIAAAALATSMGGPDEAALTLADPARRAITTSSTTTSTSTSTTTTEPPATTTTTTEPEEVVVEEEWEPPPPPPPTEPSTTVPTITASSSTTTTSSSTTTSTSTTSTVPCDPDPPGPPFPTSTTTTECPP
jgi:Hsp70 protein